MPRYCIYSTIFIKRKKSPRNEGGLHLSFTLYSIHPPPCQTRTIAKVLETHYSLLFFWVGDDVSVKSIGLKKHYHDNELIAHYQRCQSITKWSAPPFEWQWLSKDNAAGDDSKSHFAAEGHCSSIHDWWGEKCFAGSLEISKEVNGVLKYSGLGRIIIISDK